MNAKLSDFNLKIWKPSGLYNITLKILSDFIAFNCTHIVEQISTCNSINTSIFKLRTYSTLSHLYRALIRYAFLSLFQS